MLHFETGLVGIRESVKALATENERLEGTAVSAQNHAAELEQAKSCAEAELSQVKTQIEGERKHAMTALAEATTQAAGALQKLQLSIRATRSQTNGTRQGEKAHANKTNYKANYPDRRNETHDRRRCF